MQRNMPKAKSPLQWRQNERTGVSNHQHHECLLDRLFRRRSKKTSKLRVTGLCAGNSPGTGEFPAQMASNAEKVTIWWRHHATKPCTHIVSYTLHVMREPSTAGHSNPRGVLLYLASSPKFFVVTQFRIDTALFHVIFVWHRCRTALI